VERRSEELLEERTLDQSLLSASSSRWPQAAS
jgi:hypothetical protein